MIDGVEPGGEGGGVMGVEGGRRGREIVKLEFLNPDDVGSYC